MDKLLQFEYEAYTITEADKYKLIKILDVEILNIIFFCINTSNDVGDWEQFVNKLKEITHTFIQTGVFVKDHIDQESRNKFLLKGIPVIQESFIHNHPLKAIKSIFDIFEGKGTRKHIRAKGWGLCEAFFYFKLKNDKKCLKGNVMDISSGAFSAKIELKDQIYFVPGLYINEVVLSLRGIRIPVVVKIIGFSKEDSDLFIFQMFNLKIKDKKFYYDSKLPPEKIIKIYNYIHYSLRKDIKNKLDSVIIEKEKK